MPWCLFLGCFFCLSFFFLWVFVSFFLTGFCLRFSWGFSKGFPSLKIFERGGVGGCKAFSWCLGEVPKGLFEGRLVKGWLVSLGSAVWLVCGEGVVNSMRVGYLFEAHWMFVKGLIRLGLFRWQLLAS